MSLALAIQAIGWSHLLQPPLTLLLARQLRLEPAFSALPPLAAQIARNMAFASVGLPTATGVLVAIAAEEVVAGGCMRYLAWLLAAFWSWRLYRQVNIGQMMPTGWHWGLCAIFVVQGPVFAVVLIAAR
jgi:hypothetical protein